MRLWSFFCTTLISSILAFSIAALLIPPLRILPAQVLVERSEPSKAVDGILLLMGDAIDRAPHAARLLRGGYGKYIVFVEAEADEWMRRGIKPLEGHLVYDYLTKVLKVPADKIIFDRETRITSTQEEARVLLRIMASRELHSAIIATSWYHSSRAAWIFRKILNQNTEWTADKSLYIESVPSPLPSKWYQKEKDFLNVYSEYLKWIYYYARYDVFE
jgi:uncharacterized SAM-binding protein YcdF (DUF218 family)